MQYKDLIESNHKDPYSIEDKKQIEKALERAKVKHKDDKQLLDTLTKVLSHISEELESGI